jgi:putative transcriptional regulator
MKRSTSSTDVHVTNEEAALSPIDVDWDVFNATTEADIERHSIEDNDPHAHDRFPNAGPLVTKIRARFGLSQAAFAKRFGISLRTLQQWEQERRFPDGPTMLLLSIIRHEPEAVARVVSRYHRPREDE